MLIHLSRSELKIKISNIAKSTFYVLIEISLYSL